MVKRLQQFDPFAFQTFGELLKSLRERARLSQRDLARLVGYHYSYMSRLESNVRLPDEITLRTRFVPALGIQDEPELIERLLVLALGGEAPAVKKPEAEKTAQGAARGGDFPISLTPLLGRESESETLFQMLSSTEVRLVTLIGPPGVGKTRLSLHVAEQAASRFEDGAVFVDLMPVLDAGQVIPALAAALGVQETLDATVLENIKAALQHQTMLIVLDNFEQVLDAAPQLLPLLNIAPNIKMLATSREPLRLRGEQEFPLTPLAVPNEKNNSVLDFPSVQLFLQRARSAQPGFTLTEEDASRAAEICRRLDGLPLAIELAAARIRTFSLADMLEQFDRRFQWLALTARDIPEWRRTLWSAIAWSFNLLTQAEKILFMHLSVFSGGWTVEAAEAVCAEEQFVPRDAVLSTLLQLADRSLVVLESDGRYRFLDTIAKFANEKLKDDGSLPEITLRHLRYYADWAEEMEGKFNSVGAREFQKQTARELNNIRAALDWALSQSEYFIDGLRLAIPANLIWLEHGQVREEYGRAQSFLRRATDPALQPLLIRLLLRTAALGLRMGQGSLAYRYCQRAEEMARNAGDTAQRAAALLMLGDMERDTGKFEQADATLNECVALYRSLNMPSELSLSLASYGNNLYFSGKPAESKSALNEAITLASRLDDLMALGAALRVRGITLIYDQQYKEALDVFQHALDVALEAGDRPSVGIILVNLCILCNLLEDYSASGKYAAEAVTMFQSLGDEDQQAYPKRMQAYALLHQGFPARARTFAVESLLANLKNDPNGTGVYASLIAVAEIKLVEGKVEDAAQLYGHIRAHAIERFQADRPDRRALKRLEEKLSLPNAEAWQQAGASLLLEPLLVFAQQ
jgi:predicted ATPase/transcriptional regulator with XRE-family HTH domain